MSSSKDMEHNEKKVFLPDEHLGILNPLVIWIGTYNLTLYGDEPVERKKK